ncbi:hypothetical protein IIA29_07305 [candidate division KSB1 bacterium]|nr:hypothetical protein [candidate division KSB1 bacterium]
MSSEQFHQRNVHKSAKLRNLIMNIRHFLIIQKYHCFQLCPRGTRTLSNHHINR